MRELTQLESKANVICFISQTQFCESTRKIQQRIFLRWSLRCGANAEGSLLELDRSRKTNLDVFWLPNFEIKPLKFWYWFLFILSSVFQVAGWAFMIREICLAYEFWFQCAACVDMLWALRIVGNRQNCFWTWGSHVFPGSGFHFGLAGLFARRGAHLLDLLASV